MEQIIATENVITTELVGVLRHLALFEEAIDPTTKLRAVLKLLETLHPDFYGDKAGSMLELKEEIAEMWQVIESKTDEQASTN